MNQRSITIGTRGSKLAIAQAQEVISALRLNFPNRVFQIKTIQTKGDKSPHAEPTEIGSIGFFVKEIEEALLYNQCDIAVHSLKDMPLSQPAGLIVAAVTERVDPFDVLISRQGEQLPDLAPKARVGTCSARRAAQILNIRSDLLIVPMRGNIETRLRKLREEECEAIVIAAAGLQRLGMRDLKAQRLIPPTFLPSPGQGALALEVRKADEESIGMARTLNHQPTYTCVTAERVFLQGLGGGCRTAVGAYAELANSKILVLVGCLLSYDGRQALRGETEGPAANPAGIGMRLARDIIAQQEGPA